MKNGYTVSIIAAGDGTRISSVTQNNIPKVMIQLNDLPLLKYIINSVSSSLSKDISIDILDKYKDIVDNYIKSIRPYSQIAKKIKVYPHESAIGTLPVVYNALKRNISSGSKSTMIYYGDVLTNTNLERLYIMHLIWDLESHITLVSYRTDIPKECGIIDADSLTIMNPVKSIEEKPNKPKSNLAFSGIAFIDNDKSILKLMKDVQRPNTDFISDFVSKMIGKIPIYSIEIDPGETVIDIGTIENLEKARKECQKMFLAPIKEPTNTFLLPSQRT